MDTLVAPSDLPPRYLRVARHVGEGLSYRRTADVLNLSIHTVRHYVHELADQIQEPEYRSLPAKVKVMRWWLRIKK